MMRILYDPEPRSTEEIFSPAELATFRATHTVIEWRGEDRDAFYAQHLPLTDVLISQQPMEADRLAMAPNLRAIFNVETNFLPNVDYEECFRRGIHVLAPGAVFAAPVAEMALGMALSLVRNIHGEHAAFLRGEEKWLFEGNKQFYGRDHRLWRPWPRPPPPVAALRTARSGLRSLAAGGPSAAPRCRAGRL
jgi:phosphoglycerate dehydrogenase-like enzyme